MKTRPWLDESMDTAKRVSALLDVMTMSEKVGQLHQVVNPDPVEDAEAIAAGSFGTCIVASGQFAGNVRDVGTGAAAVNALQRAAVESSRLGIPFIVARDVIHGHRTVFPIPLGQAATFDADLVREAARMAAVEASADGIRWTFAPMLDVSQDARWGRVAESFGEDAHLTSLLGAAAVEGFQGGPNGEGLGARDSLAACAKHFVGYGLARGGRDYAEVDVGPVTLQNRHIRPFRAAIDAGVATVMSAFHTLDGTPMTAHSPLLRGHLKGDLGFTGPIVSDWDAVGELLQHEVARDLRDAARLAMLAGVDIDMVTGAYAADLASLVGDGEVPEEMLDDAVRRVLTLKFALGLFSRPFTDESRAGSVHLADSHRTLARTMAAGATVLLANDGVLPLPGPAKDGKESPHILLTGPFATAAEELLGTWSLDGRGEDVVTIAEAMREYYATSDTTVMVDDGRFIDESLIRARAADIVVACVGEHPMRSGEANSVTSVELPPGQLEQLRALSRVSRKLVVVVLTGRPLALEDVAPLASALVVTFHPGTEGGHGIVDVLTGAVAPSGRLPSSFPWSTGQVPLHHDHLPTGRPLGAGDGIARYRDHHDSPQFPFGLGLGYAPVEYSDMVLSSTELEADGVVWVGVRVTNVGNLPASETVQLYARARQGLRSRPVSELLDVARVSLAPGESHRVEFTLRHDALMYRDADGHRMFEPGTFTLRVAPHAGAGLTQQVNVMLG